MLVIPSMYEAVILSWELCISIAYLQHSFEYFSQVYRASEQLCIMINFTQLVSDETQFGTQMD